MNILYLSLTLSWRTTDWKWNTPKIPFCRLKLHCETINTTWKVYSLDRGLLIEWSHPRFSVRKHLESHWLYWGATLRKCWFKSRLVYYLDGILIRLINLWFFTKICREFFHRLLDVFHTTSPLRQETHLSLVFEHIEQDLSVYLENCPQPGLPEWKIKVCNC